MLKEKEAFIDRLRRLLDLGLTALAYICAYFIKKYYLFDPLRGLSTDPNYYANLFLIIIIWLIVFDQFQLYAAYRKISLSQVLGNMVKAVGVGLLIFMFVVYVFKIEGLSRLMMGIFVLLNIIFLGISKTIVYWLLLRYRSRGYNIRNVLIVGSKKRAEDVITAIGNKLGSGYNIIGCVDTEESRVGLTLKRNVQVIDTVVNIREMLLKTTVDELIFAMPLKLIENAEEYIAYAEDMGVTTRMIPDWQLHHLFYEPGVAKIEFENFLGITTLALHTTSRNFPGLFLKAAFDYSLSFILLIILMPLFLVIAGMIKLTSRGPVFFKQKRYGLYGREFLVYKFRTMVDDAEEKRCELAAINEADGPVFKIKKDPRVIPYVGTFLRKTSLDELPQLINVARGEMSLIGPRPPIPTEVDEYRVWQRRRLSMKPGLTCIWQTTPNRNEVSFKEWMKLDLEYIDNWSLWLDARIFVKTIGVMLFGRGR